MTREELREEITKICKWEMVAPDLCQWTDSENNYDCESDPLKDLNAAHEAEKFLTTKESRRRYIKHLTESASAFDDDYGCLRKIDYYWVLVSASAKERIEAIIKTFKEYE